MTTTRRERAMHGFLVSCLLASASNACAGPDGSHPDAGSHLDAGRGSDVGSLADSGAVDGDDVEAPHCHAVAPSPRLAVADMVHATREINDFNAVNPWSRMWTVWDAAAIDADLARVADLHANTVRIVLQIDAFGYPEVDPVMLQRLQSVVAMADCHGLRVHLTLFDFFHDYTDLEGSKHWASAIVAPFAGDPRSGTPPTDALFLTLHLQSLDNPGTVWFDDITFE